MGSKFNNYIAQRISDRFKPKEEEKPVQTSRYDRDTFTYERTINNVTEKFKIELGTTFRDSNNFSQFMDVVTTHMMDDELLIRFGSDSEE